MAKQEVEQADVNSNSGRDALHSFIERIERLQEDKKNVTEDIRDVFTEAKGSGFDVQVLRVVLRRRAMDKDKRDELDSLVDLYEGVLS